MNRECRLSYFPGGLAPSCSFWETSLAASHAQLTPQKLANIVSLVLRTRAVMLAGSCSSNVAYLALLVVSLFGSFSLNVRLNKNKAFTYTV